MTMKRCKNCNGIGGSGDDLCPECEGSGASACSAWLPIQVAPQDGSEVLLGWWVRWKMKHDAGGYFAQTVGAYRSGEWHLSEPGMHAADDSLSDEPEFWMPLPDPPNSFVESPANSPEGADG